jgi:hypothetical protein
MGLESIPILDDGQPARRRLIDRFEHQHGGVAAAWYQRPWSVSFRRIPLQAGDQVSGIVSSLK